MIFEDSKNSGALIFPLKFSKKSILILAYKEWLLIPNFKKQSEKLDFGVKYEYFLSFTDLLGDLCLDRNYIAIDSLSNIYSLDVCLEIITNKYFDIKLRVCFSKLLTALWIDKTPFIQLNLPNRLRVWKNLNSSQENSIACTKQDISQFKSLKQFIIIYLRELSSNGFQAAFKENENLFTESILNIIK